MTGVGPSARPSGGVTAVGLLCQEVGASVAVLLFPQTGPLGITVTIEVLGPSTLAVVVARTRASWLWASLAGIGVLALGGVGVAACRTDRPGGGGRPAQLDHSIRP